MKPISKYHENLRNASVPQTPLNVDQIIADLQQVSTASELVDVAKKYNLFDNADDHVEKDMRERWYNETGTGYWPQWNTWLIVREAYLDLLRIYKKTPRPIRSYWIPRDQSTFEILNIETPTEIIRVALTPRAPQPLKMSAVPEAPTLFGETGAGVTQSLSQTTEG